MGNRSWLRLPLEEYQGRLMRCAPGTHAAAATLLRAARVATDDTRVIDLASGTGAFLARLRDLGYRDLHAVELNVDGFRLDGVTPLPVDLNAPFAGGALPAGAFDVVSAIEIIEHLDCPRVFLRNVHGILRDGGHLLLTTPNVASWLGRLRFLLSGELRQFQRHDYDYQRHISPTTHVQMRLMFEEVGFELIAMRAAGTFFGPVKRAVVWPIAAMSRVIWGNLADGDVVIYLARKTQPRGDSAGRDSFYFRTTGA
jgi:2-polyprenyl-3-methyl-5-hydroxy-6-metoxy-1,4-benzoquinol methylase